jgi:hypothetical protein
MTSTISINCPTCGAQVEISEALFRRAEAELRITWEAEAKERSEQAALRAREDERRKSEQRLVELRELLKQSAAQLEGMRCKEQELNARSAEIERQRADLDSELDRKLREMAVTQMEELKIRVTEQSQLEISDLKNRLAEQATRLELANSAELEHRKRGARTRE